MTGTPEKTGRRKPIDYKGTPARTKKEHTGKIGEKSSSRSNNMLEEKERKLKEHKKKLEELDAKIAEDHDYELFSFEPIPEEQAESSKRN